VSRLAGDPKLPALVVAAHSDDEAVGFGIGLRERQPSAVAYLTDSAPRDPRFFTTPCASRAAYAAARRAEAFRAAAMLGVPAQSLFFLEAVDMEAYRDLERLDRALAALGDALAPQVIWSPAYDGGHPDHDVAAFLAARLARRLAVPHWEFALYPGGRRIQSMRFRGADPAVVRQLNAEEQEFKRTLLAVYDSQAPLLSQFDCTVERYRAARTYDFRQRPSKGRCLYEAWGWPVTADMLVDAFATMADTG
jgi:LmbE family N-acetylglucosaminyl deacetylase